MKLCEFIRTDQSGKFVRCDEPCQENDSRFCARDRAIFDLFKKDYAERELRRATDEQAR